MPDIVEMAYFGDLSHNGSDDSDGDGVTDWMEVRAGTDPMNAASRFSPEAVMFLSTWQTMIRWDSAPGRSYRVQYKDDLSQTNWNDLDGGVIVNGSSAASWDNWTQTNHQRFYRVLLVE